MTVTDLANANDLTTRILGGRYALGEIVGQGGTSTVYKAVDLTTASTVAIKLFHPGIELADSLPRRRREVQLAAGLHHPAIVKVLDADVEVSDWTGGRAYVVTELVNGPTLAQRLRVRPLSQSEAASMGVLLCSALAYMHQRGIVHRDLKPANILLSVEPADGALHPKLTDFGLAYMVDSTRMTGVGLTAGTPNYLSPEQVRGQPTTPASDIYALGLVVIEALTGKPAFSGQGLEAALARLSNGPSLPPNLSPWFAELLETMTAAEPTDRPNASDVGTRLSAFSQTSLTSAVLAISPETTVLASPELSQRTRRIESAGAAAGLSLLCASIIGAVVVAIAGLANGSNRIQLPTGGGAATTSSATTPQSATSPIDVVDPPSSTALSTPAAPPPAANGPAAANPSQSSTLVQIARTSAQANGRGKKNGNKP
jgi:serine/threonine protein kinase